MNNTNHRIYDVAICGAGMAGLTLARQLKQTMPDLSIVLLDRLGNSLPEATHKVGESTLSVGTYYLANILGLKDYLNQCHLPKLGLRYFFGNSQGLFEKRPELGQSEFYVESHPYQLDRGRFEMDLRQFNREAGVELVENCAVKDIQLSKTPDVPHKIVYTRGEGKTETVRARWAIDAMGRRRFLQKKLGLAQPNDTKYSAAWFRIKGRIDVSDFVPKSNRQWHDRVPDNNRYYSTNHLCGKGYWVWLIPLSSGYTSIGIVADEGVHPFSTYHTEDRARTWLEKNEPALASRIQGKPAADFKKMPRYSYSSKQVFSIDRWACVGEAGVFTDPFHSSGTDLIAIANCFITEAISLDSRGQLTEDAIDEMNRFFLTYRDRTTDRIQSYYGCFTNEVVMVLKYIWDIMTAWAFNSPLMFNSLLLDPQKRAIRDRYYDRFMALDNCVDRLFLDWAAKPGGRVTYDYIDYTKIDFMNQHRGRNFSPQKNDEELIRHQISNLEVFEELAQAIFRVAVADTMPEQLPKLTSIDWLNAEAISLHPELWPADGLFSPSTPPRSLDRVAKSLSQILQLEEPMFENIDRPKERNLGWAISSFSRTHLKVPMG